MKRILAAVATAALAGALVAVPGVAALADPAPSTEETCTPKDAWTEVITIEEGHWQRYSWTGGPHAEDDPPPFPGDGWQANTASDPHNIGQEGPYYVSHGNSGKGDWFYLEWVPPVTQTVEHDAVTCAVTVSGQATDQTCTASTNGGAGTIELGSIQLSVTEAAGIEKIEYRKQGEIASTEVDLGTLLVTGLAPGTYEFLVTVKDGYTIEDDEFTVVVGDQAGEDCESVEPIPVTAGADFQDEFCDVEQDPAVLNQAVITVHIKPGVTYSINGGTVPYDPVTGKTGPLTAGVTYTVEASATDGYQLTAPYSQDFTPTDDSIACLELGTSPLVTPTAVSVQTCEGGSFTIGHLTAGDETVQPVLYWTANGESIDEGTHPVVGAATITLIATPNGPHYGLEGDAQSEWTFTFPKTEGCDLDTLPLTGSDPNPALTVASLLGLLGIALLRSSRYLNRQAA